MVIDINKASQLIHSGEVVIIPTETVYGLGADISNPAALKKIFSTKKRPFFDPLIVHAHLTSDWKTLLKLSPSDEALKLINTFCPGPLTLVLPKSELVSDLITSGLDTLALRFPAHPSFQNLLLKTNKFIAAPSANPFKKTSPTSLQSALNYFPELSGIDGGDCNMGIESTIIEQVGKNQFEILRPGPISRDSIKKCLGEGASINYRESKKGPGFLKDHYQPEIRLALIKNKDQLFEIQHTKAHKINLPETPEIFARTLYKQLMNFPQSCDLLYILYPHKNKEEWVPITNRLEKAATIDLV